MRIISDTRPPISLNNPPHPYSLIGVDTLTVPPNDSYGKYLIIVVVEYFTQYALLYPLKLHSA